MIAIIMAGGEGQRLRPITCTQPKPMAELLNKPTMEYCVELLKKHGIVDITATLHYIPNAIQEYFKDGSSFGVNMKYSIEDEPMGTAGSVRYALENREYDSVIVISGDALTDINLSEAIKAHENSGASATLILKKVSDPTEYGVVLKDKNGFIKRFLEKPMPNEVFSDLVNTGIYILNKEALMLIPNEGVFDFSKDLFPLMLQKNMPIYGHESDGYWCDIGDIREYMNAQYDLMTLKCKASMPEKIREGVYVEKGALISDEAVLVPPCCIGRGAQIGDNVIIGPKTVIGRGVKVGRNSSIKHSVLMENACVRENCEIRGAILCEGVNIGNRNSVFEYAVIGAKSETQKGVTVEPGVLIWPKKQLESEKKYSDNIVWQKDAENRKNSYLIGYSDSQLTPERAVLIGEATANVLNRDGSIAIATDGSQQGMMLKHAIISGLISQGKDVLDMGYVSKSQFAFTIRSLALAGGVYIKVKNEEERLAEIKVYNGYGAELSANDARKLQREIEKGTKQPVTAKRLGIAEKYAGSTKAYEADLMRRIYVPKINADDELQIVVASSSDFYDTVARLLLPKGIRVRYLLKEEKDNLLKSMIRIKAKLGFSVDENDEITEVYYNDRSIKKQELDAVFLLDNVREEKNDIIVSSDMCDEYISLLCSNGARVEKTANDKSILIKKSIDNNNYLPEMFESEARVIKTVSLLLQNKLDLYLNVLPKVYTNEKEKECSWRDIGRILRTLVDSEKDDMVELIDGVRIKSDNGWVLVKPNNSYTACRIVAGSFEQEYAKELCELYREKIEEIVEEKK